MAAKKRGRTINWQKTRVIDTKKKYNGEASPYWNWLREKGRVSPDGELREFEISNPDLLVDPKSEETSAQINTRAIMKQVLKEVKLSRQEKAVLNCIGFQGFTEEKTADTLGISRLNVRRCFIRAQKKCEKLFAAKSRHAGVVGVEAYTEDEE